MTRALTLTGESTKDIEIIKRIQKEIGPEKFQEMLEHFGDTTKLEILTNLLADPAYKQWSLARLYRKAGITPTEVLDMYRKYQFDIGLTTMFSHLPKVMNDIAEDSKSREVTCSACMGYGHALCPVCVGRRLDATGEVCEACVGGGFIPGIPCFSCDSTGKITVKGDKDARNMMMEAVGATGKKSQVAVQVNVGNIPRLESTVKQLEFTAPARPVLESTPITVTDAEIVENKGGGE